MGEADVPRHADDFDRVVRVEGFLLADELVYRVGCSEQKARGGLAENHDVRGVLPVAGVDAAAGDNRNAGGLEIAR